MRLFKRKNGIWYVETKRGFWRSLKTRCEREAKLRFREIERESVREKILVYESKSIPSKDFLKNI